MRRARAFARFWWDFVVGDDWRVAAGLAAGLGLTWLFERREVSAWWLLPVTVAVVLAESVWREAQVDSSVVLSRARARDGERET